MDRFLDFCRTYQTSLMLFLQGVCVAIAFMTIFMRYLKRSRKLTIIFLELTAAANLAASRFYYLNRAVEDTAYWPWVRGAKFLDYLFVLAIILCFNFYLKDLLLHEGGLKKIPKMLFASDAILAAGAASLFLICTRVSTTTSMMLTCTHTGRITSCGMCSRWCLS